MQRYIDNYNVENRHELEQLFYRMGKNIDDIDQIRFLSLEGMEQIRVNVEKGLDPFVVAENQLQDKSKRDYFLQAKKNSEMICFLLLVAIIFFYFMMENGENLSINKIIADTTNDGVIITDRRNRIIFVNDAYKDITGFDFEDVKGKNPAEFKSGRHGESLEGEDISRYAYN
ncbi:PAS domain S-box-containing protein [Dethiosulfatibacter aminovorans DSM 17477]|uniref:PAS domain S-box-containing protein n=2 Tax=Dethiosulfatibacter TaxID=448125 RepID=A0A1M6EFV4_9FIRM|nr:PAS domain S-box protein [Dethiosulfatibacter aminovorans]SHI84366.1 PAS domain S-box-containing protein [Dethiosulfatibacter aminovorans DSM 17477]